MMKTLEVCAVSVVLKIIFSPTAVMASCPCDTGMFVTRNCSQTAASGVGVMCEPCTDCSATNRTTLVSCSMYEDSVCGPRTDTRTSSTAAPPSTAPPDTSAPEWIISTALFVSVFVFLLVLVLTWCFSRKRPGKDVFLA